MDIAQLLTNRMEARRLSGYSLAAEMTAAGHPVTHVAVSAWALGDYSPRPRAWPVLARVLRVDVEAVALAAANILTEERLAELEVST